MVSNMDRTERSMLVCVVRSDSGIQVILLFCDESDGTVGVHFDGGVFCVSSTTSGDRSNSRGMRNEE